MTRPSRSQPRAETGVTLAPQAHPYLAQEDDLMVTTAAPRKNTERERDYQQAIIEAAHAYSWRVAHFRAAQTSRGWRTAVGADGTGYPDLTCINRRQKRIVWIECKAEKGRLTDEQHEWIEWIESAGGEVYTFRPSQWDEVCGVLRPR